MSLPNTFVDNTSTPAPKTDVGFKISKPGYDARTTAGSNLVFNSSWPSLPIAFETVITNPITTTSSTATIAHNLNFYPLTFIWAYFPDSSGIGSVVKRYTGIVDKTNVYLTGAYTGTGEPYTGTPPLNATKLMIRCFNLDLSRDIDYVLAPGDTFNMPYDPNFGIKVVKQGKDINSKDMRDFALHSRCQSPLILAVKTGATKSPNVIQTGPSTFTATNVVQYTSKQVSPSWSYGFVKMTGAQAFPNCYFPAPMYAPANPKTFSDGFTTYVDYDGYADATVVILRDPMFAANQVSAQY